MGLTTATGLIGIRTIGTVSAPGVSDFGDSLDEDTVAVTTDCTKLLCTIVVAYKYNIFCRKDIHKLVPIYHKFNVVYVFY